MRDPFFQNNDLIGLSAFELDPLKSVFFTADSWVNEKDLLKDELHRTFVDSSGRFIYVAEDV